MFFLGKKDKEAGSLEGVNLWRLKTKKHRSRWNKKKGNIILHQMQSDFENGSAVEQEIEIQHSTSLGMLWN